MFWTLVGILILLPLAGFVASIFWGLIWLGLVFIVKIFVVLWEVITFPFQLMGRFLKFLQNPNKKEQLREMVQVERDTAMLFGVFILTLCLFYLFSLLFV